MPSAYVAARIAYQPWDSLSQQTAVSGGTPASLTMAERKPSKVGKLNVVCAQGKDPRLVAHS